MKIPTKVRITSKITYEVVWTDLIGNDPKTLGECRMDSRQILLKNGQSKTEAEKTFLHECLHAVEFESGISIPHNTVEVLEKGLYRVLKLNGWLK